MNTISANGIALLVIDVQKGLFEKSIPIYQANQLLANLRLLVDRAHLADVPVFFIQHNSAKVLPEGSHAWQFHARLQPDPGDTIVPKQHGNAFQDTRLAGELEGRSVRRLVICGLVTHGCVKATCQGALELGYPVTLVQDGHSSYSKDAARLIEQWNLKLSQAGAVLKPAREIDFATP